MKSTANSFINPNEQPGSIDTTLDDSLPLNAFIEKYRDRLSLAQLRWQIRHRNSNGLSAYKAILLVNRKIYVNIPNYSRWLATQTA